MQFIIGQGAFGKVKIIEDKKSKKQYALKYINKEQCIKEDCTTLIYRERMMLQQFTHPYIVSLRYAFQDDENLFMALELAQGGDLRFSMNNQKNNFNDLTLKIYIAEIGLAIEYMHSLFTVHRDLKPENLLLDQKGHILLTDLNLATSLKKRKPTSQSGTLDYMAPEMLINKPYGYSIDWWATGTILYELVYRSLPFEGGSTSDDVKKNIQTKSLKFPAKDRRGVEVVENQDRTNFIKGLLNRDVKQRLGSSNDGLGFEQDIKAHPFLADINWDLVKEKKQEPTFKPNADKDAMNFAPNLLIEEMLGTGGDPLAYKPRKKKKDPNSQSFSQKLGRRISTLLGIKQSNEDLKKKTKKSNLTIEKEHMDLHWSNFDYELEDQPTFEMPPRIVYEEESITAASPASSSTESCKVFFDVSAKNNHTPETPKSESDASLGLPKSGSEKKSTSSEQSITGQLLQKSISGSNASIDSNKKPHKFSPLRIAYEPVTPPIVSPTSLTPEYEILHGVKDMSMAENTSPPTQDKNGKDSLSQ